MDNDYMETIKGLTNTIEKLRKENEFLFHFKERFERQLLENKELWKRLEQKRGTIKITKEEDGIKYVQQIKNLLDTPEGLYIEI